MTNKPQSDGTVLTETQMRTRRQRSIATALVLAAFVVLVFAFTLVQGPGVLLNRPI